MNIRPTLNVLSLTLTAAFLSACGGSDNNKSPSTNTTPITNNPSLGTTNTGIAAADTAPAFSADFPLWNAEIDEDIRESLNASRIDNRQIRIDGQIVGDRFNLNTLTQGLSTKKAQYQANPIINNESHILQATDTLRIYKQPNSVVLGSYHDGAALSGSVSNRSFPSDFDARFYVKGNPTATLPTTGTYTYSGKSFSDSQDGSFSYSIDFGTRTGQGTIAIDNRNVVLHPANIKNIDFDYEDETTYRGFGIEGHATSTNRLNQAVNTGEYDLGIFGNNAQEIAGHVDFDLSSINNSDIGFGGIKQ